VTAIFDLVRDAVLHKRQVVARYQNHKRVLCPHTLGYKQGKEQCLFYQCGGTSTSGLGPMGSPDNWRCIRLAGLTEVAVQDGEWFTCDNHTKRQTCIDHIVAEVT